MPSADFCTAFAHLTARAVQFGSKDPQGTRCRPPEVSSIAFRTLPPEFTPDALDGYGLRGNLPARPAPIASYPVLVHWLVRLLALPSDPVSRRQPLRFAILHLHQVGARTFTSPAIEHARHTGFARCARRLDAALDRAARCGSAAIMASAKRSPESRPTLKEKRNLQITSLDFVPSWAGQLQPAAPPFSALCFWCAAARPNIRQPGAEIIAGLSCIG